MYTAPRPHRSKSSAAFLSTIAAVLLVFLVIALAAPAQEQPANTHVFRLKPMPGGCELDNVYIEFTKYEVKFKKEPEYKGANVIRGAFGVVGAPEKDAEAFTGFAYDKTGGALYVDLNRNLDLTDDPGNAYTTRESMFGEFQYVKVPIPGTAAFGQMTVRVYDTLAMATVTSGWYGEFELNGQKGRLVVIDNLDGVINNNDALIITNDPNSIAGCDNATHPNRLSVPKRLMLNGVVYDLQFAFEGVGLVATFTTADVPLGQVTLENSAGITRLILQTPDIADGGATAAIVDNPGRSFTLPVGGYSVQDIFLLGGNPPGLFHARHTQSLTVMSSQTTSFKAGPPLKNILSAERSGRTFTFNYMLVGSEGEPYKELDVPLSGTFSLGAMPTVSLTSGRDRGVLPEVLVALNGKQIASGKFQYG